MAKRMKGGSRMVMNNATKRMFNNKIDNKIEELLSRLPQGNVGYAIVGLNVAFYGLMNLWPAHKMNSFIDNFTFSLENLQRGYFWNMFTCHFTHMGFFSFALDSIILFMFCQNLGMMFGNLFVAKTVIASMGMGSLFLLAHHATSAGQPRGYCGNDAILRGLIFSLIF